MKTSLVVLGFLVLLTTACDPPRKSAAGSTAADTDNSLLNKRWVLRELPGTTLPDLERDIHITFRPGSNRMDGFAGCNTISGTYTVKDRELKIGDIGGTEMMCNYMDTERKVMEILGSTNHYTIAGDELKLLKDDEMLGRFEAVYLK